jgi:hypothetical protein
MPVYALSLNTPRSLMGSDATQVITPRSMTVKRRNTKTGTKSFEGRCREALRQQVCELFAGGHVQYSELAQLNTFTNEVYIQLDVLRPLVMDRIRR